MELITKPEDIPKEKYHTVDIEKTNDGDFKITARNDETAVSVFVGSVGINGESVGVVDGEVRFDAAGSSIWLEYVDYTEEYGYGEVQVRFEEFNDTTNMNPRTFLQQFEESAERDRIMNVVYDEMVHYCKENDLTEDDISTEMLESLAEAFVERGLSVNPSDETKETKERYRT